MGTGQEIGMSEEEKHSKLLFLRERGAIDNARFEDLRATLCPSIDKVVRTQKKWLEGQEARQREWLEWLRRDDPEPEPMTHRECFWCGEVVSLDEPCACDRVPEVEPADTIPDGLVSCVSCGSTFRLVRASQRVCSRRCAEDCGRTFFDGPAAVYTAWARKKAGRQWSHKERYDRMAIFERDGFRCHLCRKKINMDSKGADRPTLDHLVPYAKGGADTAANVRPAHMNCNSSKQTKPMGEQLMLLG
jgi:5-methylcytosine-specific restriction endonuclease McrA